jgi:hypothetical protein
MPSRRFIETTFLKSKDSLLLFDMATAVVLCVICQQPAQYGGVHGTERLPYCSLECYHRSCPQVKRSHKREQQAQDLIEAAMQQIGTCTKSRALEMATCWQISHDAHMSSNTAPEERPELVGLRYNLVNPTDLHRYFISSSPDHLVQLADKELRKRLVLHNTRAAPETLYGRDRWVLYGHAITHLWQSLDSIEPCREKRLAQLRWVQDHQTKHLYHHLIRVMRTHTANCPADVCLTMRFSRVLMSHRGSLRNGVQAMQEYWNTWITPTRYGQSGMVLQSLVSTELIQHAEHCFANDPWRMGGPGTRAFYEVVLLSDNPLGHHSPPVTDCGARLLCHSKQHTIECWLQPWLDEFGPACTHTPLWMWLRYQLEKHWEQAAVSLKT